MRTALLAGAAVAFLVLVALGASAALDAPSRSAETAILIDARREDVWNTLMDFGSYPDWNPYMRVRGRAGPGETLEVRLDPPAGDDEEVSAEVFVYRPPRKLRWQGRLLVPGLRDLEYEVIVAPASRRRTLVVQRARHEGLLAVFVDVGSVRSGLEGMGSALKRRMEAER